MSLAEETMNHLIHVLFPKYRAYACGLAARILRNHVP